MTAPQMLRRRTRYPIAVALGVALSFGAGCASAGAQGGAAGATLAIGADFTLPPLPEARPISEAEYAARRAALAATFGDGVFVAFGTPEPELDYLPYLQEPSFRYLTGITEPGAGLILAKQGGQVEEIVFVRPRRPDRELWEGARIGVEGIARQTGMAARPADQLVATLDSITAIHGTIYALTPLPAGEGAILTREQQILARVVEANPGSQVIPLADQIQQLRGRKSAAEQDMIRRAAIISAIAHREAIRSAAPGMNEFEIQALVEYIFRRLGGDGPAYASIVGSGPNSTTLHYRADDRFMRDGELIVMDVAAAYRGYAADVTRTIPISGRFTPDQRLIYDLVLSAQAEAERRVRVGATWGELESTVIAHLSEGLTELGLIDSPDAMYDCDSPATGNRCPQFRLFYMHGLGHGVGLEVHDPDISDYGSVQVGSAFTLEPGVYIRSDVLDYLPDTAANRAMIERLRPAVTRFRDIGVRIEDVYLVTEDGVERPSSGVPREADEVEALAAETGFAEVGRQTEIIDWYRATTPAP